MNRNVLIRLGLAGITGVVAGGLVVAVLSLLDAEGIRGCVVARGWGVLVPVVTGLFVATAAWGIISVRDDESEDAVSASARECPECGGTILGDWRLCPHCGTRIPGATSR